MTKPYPDDPNTLYDGRSENLFTKAMTEDELLQAITEAATYLGWRWTHTRRSDQAQIMGHSGVPDLLLARAGRVMFLELKTEKGRVSPDQQAWLDALFTGAHVVHPSDLDTVLEWLK